MAEKKSQKSLKNWGDQDWGYVTEGDKKKPKKKRGRYLPKSVRSGLTASQKAATNKKKRKAGGVGSRAKYSKKVAKKVSSVSKLMKYTDIQKDNGIKDYLYITPSEIKRTYQEARDAGYSVPDANRLSNPTGTYDDPINPISRVLPKLKRPTFLTDAAGKIVGRPDKDTREKGTRIFREVTSQKEPMKTGGYSDKDERNYYTPFPDRPDEYDFDWSGYDRIGRGLT